MKVIALPEVREYLMELIQILYKKEYFGFEENAQKYVEELIFDIKNNLPLKLNKPAPPYFDRYGKKMLYATFRKNRGRKVNCVMRCFSFKLIGRGSASAKGVHQHSRRA